MNLNKFVLRMEEAGEGAAGGTPLSPVEKAAAAAWDVDGDTGFTVKSVSDEGAQPSSPSEPVSPSAPASAAPVASPAPVVPAAIPGTPAAPVVPVIPQPQPQPTAPVLPVQPPQLPPLQQQQPAQQPGQQPSQPAAPTSDFNAYMTARASAVQEVQNRIKFTPEQEEALLTNPGPVLAQLAAEIQVDTYAITLRQIAAQLPTMVMSIITDTSAAAQRESSFYKANADLAQADRNVVNRIAYAYFTANPTISEEVANREIGALVRSSLGIAPTVTSPAPAPAVMQQPQQPQPNIFRTALGSSASTPAAPAAPNAWEELAKIL